MDGMHRVCKTLNSGMDFIDAYQRIELPPPDFIGIAPRDLSYGGAEEIRVFKGGDFWGNFSRAAPPLSDDPRLSPFDFGPLKVRFHPVKAGKTDFFEGSIDLFNGKI